MVNTEEESGNDNNNPFKSRRPAETIPKTHKEIGEEVVDNNPAGLGTYRCFGKRNLYDQGTKHRCGVKRCKQLRLIFSGPRTRPVWDGSFARSMAKVN